MHHANHFRALNLECSTAGNGRGRGQSQAWGTGNRLLANKLTRPEQRDRCFFAFFRNDGDLRAALLKIENSVSRTSLGKKDLLCFSFDDPPTKACLCQKGSGIEIDLCRLIRWDSLFDIGS